MKRFARLLADLDAVRRTDDRVHALTDYFRDVPSADAAWAAHLLAAGRTRRIIAPRQLADWAAQHTGTEDWLFAQCHDVVGDLNETAALLLPDPAAPTATPLHEWVERRLLPLAEQAHDAQRAMMLAAWAELNAWERFVWNRLVSGAFRSGVMRTQLVRAVAGVAALEDAVVAQRLATPWEPTPEAYARITAPAAPERDATRALPFHAVPTLDVLPHQLGDIHAWRADRIWQGPRVQLVRRGGRTYVWSDTEELLTDRVPEVVEAAALLPDDTVLEGRLVALQQDCPADAALLARRFARSRIDRRLLRELPVALLLHDVLVLGGDDLRALSLTERLERAAGMPALSTGVLRIAEAVPAASWDDVQHAYARARDLCTDGLLLRRRAAAYDAPRAAFEWRVQPHSVTTVLMYATTDMELTFGVWDDAELVPFAKTTAGLTDADSRRIDSWVRRNTVEKFGPVRAVPPQQVFDIEFDAITASARHRSGVVVTGARVVHWHERAEPRSAATLGAVQALASRERGTASAEAREQRGTGEPENGDSA